MGLLPLTPTIWGQPWLCLPESRNLPTMKILQPLWDSVPWLHHPSTATGCPYLQPEPPKPGLASAAPCFFVCLYREEFISVIRSTTIQLLQTYNKAPQPLYPAPSVLLMDYWYQTPVIFVAICWTPCSFSTHFLKWESQSWTQYSTWPCQH